MQQIHNLYKLQISFQTVAHNKCLPYYLTSSQYRLMCGCVVNFASETLTNY